MNHPKPTRDFAWYYRPLEAFLLALAALPMSVLYVLADGLYLLMRYVLRYRHKVVFGNIRNSFPDKSEAWVRDTAHGFYRHFADTIVEIIKLGAISPEEYNRRIYVTNPELGDAAFAKGRAIICLGSHHGNWEWIAPAGAQRWPGKVDGVYKPLSNPFFDYYIYRLRTRLGTGLIPMRETKRDMEANRGKIRSLCMLADQCPPNSRFAYWTRTLNQDTAFFTGSDRLAVQYQCPVLYVSIRRVRRGYYTLTLEEIYDGSAPLDLAEHPITEAYARRIERDIVADPTRYLWSHKRWKLKKE
jgi:KDO2-lipid IV(A) lauroyltransferase